MKLVNFTAPDRFDIRINGTCLEAATRTERAVFIMSNDTWIEYPIAPDVLAQGLNRLEIQVHSLNPQMADPPVLQTVELVVRYR